MLAPWISVWTDSCHVATYSSLISTEKSNKQRDESPRKIDKKTLPPTTQIHTKKFATVTKRQRFRIEPISVGMLRMKMFSGYETLVATM